MPQKERGREKLRSVQKTCRRTKAQLQNESTELDARKGEVCTGKGKPADLQEASTAAQPAPACERIEEEAAMLLLLRFASFQSCVHVAEVLTHASSLVHHVMHPPVSATVASFRACFRVGRLLQEDAEELLPVGWERHYDPHWSAWCRGRAGVSLLALPNSSSRMPQPHQV